MEESTSEPTMFEEALEYDPSEISADEVTYDGHRFKRLMESLNADTWKLTRKQRKAAEDVLFRNQKVFNLKNEKLPQTHLLQHDIQLTDENKVIFVKPRWTPIHQRPPIEAEVKGLLKYSLVEPTTSPHSSPVVLVKKKEKGKWHLAMDYRVVNKNTVPMYYPIANIEEVVFKVAKSKIHSALDLRSGFLQVGLTIRARPITAFSCHLGHHAYLCMPFGLVNAPHTMNKLMQMVFGDVSEYVSNFFDDIFIHSDSVEDLKI